jgi:hypothetical protein
MGFRAHEQIAGDSHASAGRYRVEDIIVGKESFLDSRLPITGVRFGFQ